MGSADDNDKTKDRSKLSTTYFQRELGISESKDEATLPDYLLSENSPEKKKRDQEKETAALIEAAIVGSQIKHMQMEYARTKHDENKKRSHIRHIEDIKQYFHNLSFILIENEMRVKLSQLQIEQLKLLEEKFQKVLNYINTKIFEIDSNIFTVKNDITSLNQDLTKLREEFSYSLSQRFDKKIIFPESDGFDINVSNLLNKEERIAAGPGWNGSITIDEKLLRQIGKSVCDVIRFGESSLGEIDQIIQREIDKYLTKELTDILNFLPKQTQDLCIKRLANSREFLDAKQFIFQAIHNHIQPDISSSKIENLIIEFNKVMEKLFQKHDILNLLEEDKEKFMLGKASCESFLDIASNISEKGEAPADVIDQVLVAGPPLAEDLLKNICDFSEEELAQAAEMVSEPEETPEPPSTPRFGS